MEIFIEDKITDEVNRKAKIVDEFLRNEICVLDSRIKYRGLGLIWGVDFSGFDSDMTKPLIAACFRNGLIIERVGRDNPKKDAYCRGCRSGQLFNSNGR